MSADILLQLRSHRTRSRAERRAETRRTRGLLLGRSRAARAVAFAILALVARFATPWSTGTEGGRS